MACSTAGGDRTELENVLGIAYEDADGVIVVNGPRPRIEDVDSIPFPRRDEHVHRPYFDAWRSAHGYISLPGFGARGCPFDCASCYRPVFGKYYRMRSPENIVAELEQCASGSARSTSASSTTPSSSRGAGSRTSRG